MIRTVTLHCIQSIFMPRECAVWNPFPSSEGYVSIGATTIGTIREDGSYAVHDCMGNIYLLPSALAEAHFIEV